MTQARKGLELIRGAELSDTPFDGAFWRIEMDGREDLPRRTLEKGNWVC